MVRFTSADDYEFVMTQGPWMLGDSYLTIRKWVPNFIADEAPMRHLTAWVRIPNLSVEYFDKTILHRIGSKIGTVIKIDRNTESMDRGQYVRFCVEVDLSKPLLSKFKLNGRIWKIQYEGLKMICFKCGHLGHKEDSCDIFHSKGDGPVQNKGEDGGLVGSLVHTRAKQQGPELSRKYGEWMLVSKTNRRSGMKGSSSGTKDAGVQKHPHHINLVESNLTEEGPEARGSDRKETEDKSPGSRFGVLGEEDMDIGESIRVNTPVSTHKVAPHTVREESSRKEDDILEITTDPSEDHNPNLDGIQPEEIISPIGIKSMDANPCGDGNIVISLNKAPLFPKNQNLEISRLGSSARNPREPPAKVQAVRVTKFKKGPSRKKALQRGVDKENIPGLSKPFFKPGSVSVDTRQKNLDHGGVTPKNTNYSGVQDPTSGGDLCGTTSRGPVNDSGSSVCQSGAYGDQLIHPPGERGPLPNDESGLALHHRRPDEGLAGDVPYIN